MHRVTTLVKVIFLFLLNISFQGNAIAQSDTSNFEKLKSEFSQNKILPTGYEKQALIALSFFPELKDKNIEFILKETTTPLASRPSIWSVFKRPQNRYYMISISTKSIEILDKILLKNLDYQAQIGVLAHEISHVANYNKMNFWNFLRLGLGLLSSDYMDTFEYNTDQTCIDHGAGRYLLAWSKAVRKVFTKEQIESMFGKDAAQKERYMNPETIERIINTHPLYQLK
jgi:hypothetical protein